MKRKFSFSSLRLKTVAPAPSQAPTPDDLESPPYSPTPSCMERPVLEKNLENALKQSCAILVNETNPPSDDFEEVPDQKEALRRYLEERDATAKRHAREVKEKRHNEVRRPKTEQSDHEPSPYKHVPRTAATDFEKNAKAKNLEMKENGPVSVDPVQPYHLEQKALANPDPDDPIGQIRATLDSRPKTSAAACVDYPASTIIQQSGTSTSRTTTTFDSHQFRTTSTAGTSLAITPNDDKRSPYGSQRVSNQQNTDPEEAGYAEAAAKIWMQQELARRRAEKKAGPARPGSRASTKVAHDHADRPVSRAGSIAESVRDGIRDYIRPRSSHDSIRSSGGSDLSRTHSRSSSTRGRRSSNGSASGSGSGSGWFKGVRRRGSFSSWRSSKPVEGEPETAPGTSSGPAGQPNLNRELPPLPGLDQYKEQKPKPMHIASVMRPVSKPRKSPQSNLQQQQQQQLASQYPSGYPNTQTQTPPAMMLPALRDQYFAQSPSAFQRVGSPSSQQNPFRSPRLSPEQEVQRQAEVRAAIEEKMRLGAMMASRGSGYYNPVPIVKTPYEIMATPGSPSLSPNTAISGNVGIPSPRSAAEMHGYGYHGSQPRSPLGMPVGPEGDVMRARSEPVIKVGKGVKTVTVVEPLKTQKATAEKGKGLRKRLSRFWSHSGAKPVAAN